MLLLALPRAVRPLLFVSAILGCEAGDPVDRRAGSASPAAPPLVETGAPAQATDEPVFMDEEALRTALVGQSEAIDDQGADFEAPPSPGDGPRHEEREAKKTARRRAPASSSTEVVKSSPSLSDGAFQSVINGWSGFKRCLENMIRRFELTSGSLRVELTIRGDGQVVKSRAFEMTNALARSVAPCVERRAKRLKFPPFASSQDEIEKAAKFIF